MKLIEVYIRCSGDCLFATLHCPRDGWSTQDTQAIYRMKVALRRAGITPSVERIRSELAGKVDPEALDRLVEVTFPDERLVVDCFVPFEQDSGAS